MALRGSIGIDVRTPLKTWDLPAERMDGRVVGFTVDDSLDIHLHGYEGDADRIVVCERLIATIGFLRDSAVGRIADLAAIDDASPAQGHEVVAEWTRPEFPTSGAIRCVRCDHDYAECVCDPITGWPAKAVAS